MSFYRTGPRTWSVRFFSLSRQGGADLCRLVIRWSNFVPRVEQWALSGLFLTILTYLFISLSFGWPIHSRFIWVSPTNRPIEIECPFVSTDVRYDWCWLSTCYCRLDSPFAILISHSLHATFLLIPSSIIPSFDPLASALEISFPFVFLL